MPPEFTKSLNPEVRLVENGSPKADGSPNFAAPKSIIGHDGIISCVFEHIMAESYSGFQFFLKVLIHFNSAKTGHKYIHLFEAQL